MADSSETLRITLSKLTGLFETGPVEQYQFSYIKTLTVSVNLTLSSDSSHFYHFPAFKCPNLKVLKIRSNANLLLGNITTKALPQIQSLSLTSIRSHYPLATTIPGNTQLGITLFVEFPTLQSLETLEYLSLKYIEFFKNATTDHETRPNVSIPLRKCLRLPGPWNLKELVEIRNRPNEYGFNQTWDIYRPSIICPSLETIILGNYNKPTLTSKLILARREANPADVADDAHYQTMEYFNLKKFVAIGHYNTAAFINLPKLKSVKFLNFEPVVVIMDKVPKLRFAQYKVVFNNWFYLILSYPYLNLFTAIRFVLRYLWYFSYRCTVPCFRFRYISRPVMSDEDSLDEIELLYRNDAHHRYAAVETNWFQNKITGDGSFGFNEKRAVIFLFCNLACIHVFLIVLKVRSLGNDRSQGRSQY